MRDGLNKVNDKLTSFKRKYYFNLFLRGALLTLALTLAYFILAAVLEYTFWLNSWLRFAILVAFFGVVAFSVYRFLRQPLRWWVYRKGLGQEEAARMVGSLFPDIRDRLVNLIQLSLSQKPTSLLEAGISQKASQFEHVPFESAIDLGDNRRYLKYLLIPAGLIVLILVFNRAIVTQSTQRIVQFNREFTPQAPFRFVVANQNLNAFFNEDFTLKLDLQGEAIPDAAYLVTQDQRIKMEMSRAGEFSYTFEKLQNEVTFRFEASGFNSVPYTIHLVNRPELTHIKMNLQFPRYLGKRDEQLSNSGNVEIPEGTRITWQIATANASKALIGFTSDPTPSEMQISDNQLFTYSKAFHEPDGYQIDLQNENSSNKDRINYSILVVKDQYPQIEVDHLKDSVLYKTIYLGGTIRDDYGLTELSLKYQINRHGKAEPSSHEIAINKASAQQNFFYQWHVDSLGLQPGDKIEYYLQVWDNDGVNGRKSTLSRAFVFELPGVEELKATISKSQSEAESKINESLTKAKDIRESLDEAQQKLKGKQAMDWQDKKMLENLVEQKNSLDQMINELKKQNELLDQKKDAFSEQNEKIREKAEQIQKLMDELLDPEMKKLFDELEKLLKDNSDMNQIQKMLEKLDRKEINLEKELERTLELFKQMKYDYKVDQAINELKKAKENQEALLEKTDKLDQNNPKDSDKKSDGKKDDKKQKDKDNQKGDDKNSDKGDNKGDNKSDNKGDQEDQPGKDQKDSSSQEQNGDNEQLADEQEQVEEDFDQFEKTLDDVKKMGDELKKDEPVPSEKDRQEIKDSQQQSKESLKQGSPKKSSTQQRKSINKMQQMLQQMESLQSSMDMEIDMENLESLRQIIHGLIKLSFDEESLMKEFAQVQQTDPRYIQLSQNQLKIRDDSKVLEDSLLALSKRDASMGAIVNKEVGELNGHLDKTADHIKERRKTNASAEMQLSMTSINNLAVMLDDHYDMMMNMMAQAQPSSGKSKGKQQQPSLGKLQQQLNDRIQQLKNGGKSGREYSEELAKMAAEQERIRRALQELQERLKNEGGKTLGNDIPAKMEQTETDLVNKQITEQTIRRQKEIEVRLLEAEKALREQDMDEERKGEAAKDYDKEIPRAFEDYLRLKEKEVELLKTVPPKLYPYYKKEVNDYFKRIGNP